MTLEERKQSAITRITKAVFPNDTNHYNTLFGGLALYLMDEVAFICATRFAKKRMVTISSNKVDFKHPIAAGNIVEFVASVKSIGNTSMVVLVEIFLEEMYGPKRFKAIDGEFTFVAIDEERNPIKVL
jgi:acyl-CoA hydrolase